MQEGTWTIGPCPHGVQAELARALGISELTASALVRRGYRDAAAAQAFLAGDQPPHDPFLLGDMHRACERIRAAVAEVAEARGRGLEVIVTDHHRPGETLPDCPIVATRPSRYPFPELCGTGVVYKLGQALHGTDSEIPQRHLDLVALATIADVVPLVDENRSLATAGLRALARTQKPGLQALMRAAGVDPAIVDAGSVGFRLAPRINAAGRLGHPRAALQLLLTDDEDDARRLANDLEDLNRERQAVEGRILREAVQQVEEWPDEHKERRAYVVAGENWHEGVIGIV